MNNIENIKSYLSFNLNIYEVNSLFFKEGDFGSLNQLEFNSERLGGNIDIWGLNWLGIFIWDYEKEEEILNVLLGPNQEEEKLNALAKLKEII